MCQSTKSVESVKHFYNFAKETLYTEVLYRPCIYVKTAAYVGYIPLEVVMVQIESNLVQ